MKYSVVFLTIVTLSSQLVIASEISEEFKSGQILTAEKMGKIKKAVNDNDSRVRGIDTQISKLSEGCPVGQSIRAVAANGDITCEVDNSGGGAGSGSVSVHGVQFNYDFANFTEDKPSGRFSGRGLTNNSSTRGSAQASISLPHGVTVKGLKCRVSNDTADTNFVVHLKRLSITNNTSVATMFTTNAAVARSAAEQFLFDTSANTSGLIDNSNFVYNLALTLPSGGGAIRGCAVSY